MHVAIETVGKRKACKILLDPRQSIPSTFCSMDKTTKVFVISACSVVIAGGAISGGIVATSVFGPPLRCFAGHIQSKFSKNPDTGLTSMDYEVFRTDVKNGKIAGVRISLDRGTAQVIEKDGGRFFVRLAPDKDLLKLLTDNSVDIAVQPNRVIAEACNF